jgi:hypothetical protein
VAKAAPRRGRPQRVEEIADRRACARRPCKAARSPAAAGPAIDDAVAWRRRRSGVPVNVVDRPERSSFIMPAIVDRDPVVVAISWPAPLGAGAQAARADRKPAAGAARGLARFAPASAAARRR